MSNEELHNYWLKKYNKEIDFARMKTDSKYYWETRKNMNDREWEEYGDILVKQTETRTSENRVNPEKPEIVAEPVAGSEAVVESEQVKPEGTEPFDEKTQKLMDKLNILGEKIAKEKEAGKMNPFKKLFLQTKLDFLESKLQKRLYEIKLNNLIDRENLDEEQDIAEYRAELQEQVDIYGKIIDDNYSLIEQEQAKIDGLQKVSSERNATLNRINNALPEGIKPIKAKNENPEIKESQDKIKQYREEIKKAEEELRKINS